MWNGKKKAVTFSFDDGVTQDIAVIEILNKYGLKGTFNLNSSLFGLPGCLEFWERKINHTKIPAGKVKEIYAGHEVAVHTLTHPLLPSLSDETVVYQVEEDRKALSKLCGYEVVGMAYPCGGVNNDDRVAEVIRTQTGVKYSRTITSTKNFDLQTNYYRFNPSVHICEDDFEELVDKFLALQSDEPQLFYILGHAYEMDSPMMSLEKFDRICAKLANKTDIFYGTNKDVLL